MFRGEKKRKPRQTEQEIERTKLKEILAKGLVERDEKMDTDRVAGLGFAP